MSETRRYPKVNELAEERREVVLAAAADTVEIRSLRKIAANLPATLPAIAKEARLPLWLVSRTLNGARPADVETVKRIREALGVSILDVLAAKQAAAERVRT